MKMMSRFPIPLHQFASLFFQLKFELNSTWTQLNLNWTSDETLHKFVLHLYMKTSWVCVTSVHKNFMNKEISYRDLGRFRYTDCSTVHTTLLVQEHDGKKKRKTLNIRSGHCHLWPTVQRFWKVTSFCPLKRFRLHVFHPPTSC